LVAIYCLGGGERLVGGCFDFLFFIAGIALSQSFFLAPRPPPPPSPVNKLDRRHTGRRRKRDNFLTNELGEGGRDPKHTIARKSGTI
jgi:hypothetical protein